MPPPVVAPGRSELEDEELDPRALKALSRQERREAKAALRREQAEARNAARQAKALAKAAAKAGITAAADDTDAKTKDKVEAATDVAPEVEADVADEGTAEIPVVAEDVLAAPETSAEPPEPTDPRARAAARIQRRLGKDAEKLSAAEARAKAREEARSRRAQAKELRSGGVVAAEEPVVREADEVEAPEADLVDESVESIVEQTVIAEPILEEPVLEETAIIEPVIDEPEIEEPAFEEPVVEEPLVEESAADEPEMARPSLADRIDEPGPVDEPEDNVEEQIDDEPDEVVEEPARVEVQRKSAEPVPTTLPMEDEEKSKRPLPLAPIAGVVGLIALGLSVLLAIGALLVALGFDSGGLYNVLRAVLDTLVGPLNNAFDFEGASAERKEHFLAWGAGSIGYLVLSFIGQAVQRANADEE